MLLIPASSINLLAMPDEELVAPIELLIGNLFTVTGLVLLLALLQESGLRDRLPVSHD